MSPIEPGTVSKLRTLVVVGLCAQRRTILRAAEVAHLSGAPLLPRDRDASFRVTLPAADAQALEAELVNRPGPLAAMGRLIVWQKAYPEGKGAVTVHVMLSTPVEVRA